MGRTGARRARVVLGTASADEAVGEQARVLARVLRDAGGEVVWTGAGATAEQLVATAIQEDAEVVVVLAPAGAGAAVRDRLTRLVDDQGLDDLSVRVGATAADLADVVRRD